MTKAADPVLGKFGIKLYDPTPSKPYYRFDYNEPRTGQRKQPSAGPDQRQALAKLTLLEAELEAGLGNKGRKPFGAVIDEFLKKSSEAFSTSHFEKTQTMLNTYARPRLGALPAWTLTQDDVAEVLDLPTSPSGKRHLRAAMGSLLTWAFERKRVSQPRASFIAKESMTGRSKAGQQHGQGATFIAERLRPSSASCRMLADRMYEQAPDELKEQLWLMAALSASSGPRQGELFAARPEDFSPDGELEVLRQATRPKGGGVMETPPKWGKTRTTFYPRTTIWGAELEDRLLTYLDTRPKDVEPPRMWQLLPKGTKAPWLAFPAWRGGYFNPSTFDRDFSLPARRSLPRKTKSTQGWDQEWTWHSLRHAFCSWMLNPDPESGAKPSSVVKVSRVVGHQNPNTTMTMYVGETKENVRELRDNAG